MQNKRTVIFLLVCALIAISAAVYAEALSEPLLQQLASLTEDNLNISYHHKTGKVRFLRTDGGAPIRQPALIPPDTEPETAARNFLATYGPLFGIEDQAMELILKREKIADRNRSFVRFQQLYRHVPVIAGELIVQMECCQHEW
jgi:hypothetical protein